MPGSSPRPGLREGLTSVGILTHIVHPNDRWLVRKGKYGGHTRPDDRRGAHPAGAACRSRLVTGPTRRALRGQQGRAGRARARPLQSQPGHAGPDRRRVRRSRHAARRRRRGAGRPDQQPGRLARPVARPVRRHRHDPRCHGAAVGGGAVALGGDAGRGVRRRRACAGHPRDGLGRGGPPDPDRRRGTACGRAGPVRPVPGQPPAPLQQRGPGAGPVHHDRRHPAGPGITARRPGSRCPRR